MTDKEFEDIKNGYLKNVKQYLQKAGGLFPHISIFADHKEEEDKEKHAIIHVPIPDSLMNSEKGKDTFVDKILPDVMSTVKEKFNVKGIAWASEAWMRHLEKGMTEIPTDWKSLPKKEVLIVTIETANKNEVCIYEMKRDGLTVNDDGDMIDTIELIPIEGAKAPDDSQGRFTGLYRKYVQDPAL